MNEFGLLGKEKVVRSPAHNEDRLRVTFLLFSSPSKIKEADFSFKTPLYFQKIHKDCNNHIVKKKKKLWGDAHNQ